MLQLRSASRACLRAFLLACTVVVGSYSNSYAQSIGFVNLSFINNRDWAGNVVGANQGRFFWNVNSTSNTAAANVFPTSPAWTFCIQTDQNTGSNLNFEILNTLVGLPAPAGLGVPSIDPAKNSQLQALATLIGENSFRAANTAATIQNAIWAIVGWPSGSISGSLLTQINNRAADIANNLFQAGLFFYGLKSNSGQDQIVLVDGGGNGFGGNVVPVPAGVVMAGMGVVCLGGFNILRRRRKVAAV